MTPGACGVHAHEHNLVPCSLENLDVGDCLEVLDTESTDAQVPSLGTPKIHDALEDSHNQYYVIVNGTFQDLRPNA